MFDPNASAFNLAGINNFAFKHHVTLKRWCPGAGLLSKTIKNNSAILRAIMEPFYDPRGQDKRFGFEPWPAGASYTLIFQTAY